MYELFIWLVVVLIGLGIISSLVGAALAYYDHIKVKKAIKNLKEKNKNE